MIKGHCESVCTGIASLWDTSACMYRVAGIASLWDTSACIYRVAGTA